MGPTLLYELAFWEAGHRLIVGLDEVGRGCLAGPVVAGAVVLPVGERVLCGVLRAAGLRDSKQLSATRRESLVPLIEELALGVAIGVGTVAEINAEGIVPACRRAMQRAIQALPCPVEALLLDAFPLPSEERPQRAIVRGDDASLSIAAASVVAKVYRDRLMVAYDQDFPGYDFASNKGYAAPAHRAALQTLGATSIHRMNWAPLRALTAYQLLLEDPADGPT
ncbi:MAG: ribonuclease HII [Ardenticatenales bacterium]|nr:ribonuclease HII [Ardenticatenales bacterium]